MSNQNSIRAAGQAYELIIYEDIDAGFARHVVEQLRAARQASAITVRLNSPGGAVGEAIAVYNALAAHPSRVTIYIDGLAASSASMIAMAGDHVVMAANALMMIHDPWGPMTGTAGDHRRMADTLDKHGDAMVKAYAAKSGQSREEVLEIMSAETWYSADEALAAGFVDDVAPELAIAASLDLSRFNNPPRMEATMPPENDDPNKNTPAAGPQSVPEIDAAVRAERERIQARNREVQTRFQGVMRSHPDNERIRALYDDVMADTSITADQACAKLLDEMARGVEPANPSGFAPDPGRAVRSGRNEHQGEFRAAVTDAILGRYGIPVAKPHPAASDVRGMDMAAICATMLEHAGRSTRGMSRAEIVSAGMTTSDLPSLLSGTANKAVMTGFEEQETATHRTWTRRGELADFKEAKRIALSEAPGLEKVGEHGEYKRGYVVDAGEPIKAETYGRIAQITRQALVNDDLGELARLPFAMGQAAARKEADLVYTLLTSNPAMRDGVALFHADHGNLASAAPLSVESLGDARRRMRLQKGLRGEATLNLPPRFLIVPAALETAAEKLLADVQPTKASDATPEWIRRLELVVDSRLDESSETSWYLASSPDAHDTIEVAHVGGQGAEILTEEGFDIDALKLKVRLDVGAAVLDWRGLVHNPGNGG